MTTPSPEGTLPRAVATEACLGAGRGERNPQPNSGEGQRTTSTGAREGRAASSRNYPVTVRTGFPDPHGSRSRIWGL